MGVAFRDASGTEAVGSGWCRDSTPGGRRMATKKDGQIVETPTEARQAEPGPSILLILIVSVVLAAIVLGVVWFIFFRT
jgi:cobalamin biosynthesis Mg chelatase CobN